MRIPRRKEKGQAIVEFVLVIPVLLAMASLIIDMANIVFIAHRLSSATREGARIATETTVPAPEEPGPSDACQLNGCAESSSICCIAVNRTNLVLFNSGVRDAEVEGRWFLHTAGGRDYSMFEVRAETDVNFFFGLGNQELSSASVAYGDEV